jgi:hypothetical protein
MVFNINMMNSKTLEDLTREQSIGDNYTLGRRHDTVETVNFMNSGFNRSSRNTRKNSQ